MIEQIAFMALGGVIGTLFWLYALIVYFPRKFEDAERKIQGIIEEKEVEYNHMINDILNGKDDTFNKVIEDITPQIVGKIKAELPDIEGILDERLPGIIEAFKRDLPSITDQLLDDLGDPENPKMRNVIMNIAGGAYYSLMGDPEIKRSIQGHINGYMNGAVIQIENRIGLKEQDIKDLRELIAFFNANKDKLGALANVGQGNQGGGFDPMQMMMGFMGGGQQ